MIEQDQLNKIAIHIQDETMKLAYFLCSDYTRMSEQTKQVIALLSINQSYDQVIEHTGFNLKPDTIKRYAYRYREVIDCCSNYATAEYKKHHLI
ncbi:hypothetical protein [Vibrio casei]|uniref:hypothetical protein n=1 Tax=Vibrio casei TaxID=673372 RepID=UPI000DA69DFD|nr:hypothetical protein [Vibrio casei]